MKSGGACGDQEGCRLLQLDPVAALPFSLQTNSGEIETEPGCNGNISRPLDHHLPDRLGNLLGLRTIDRGDRARQIPTVDYDQRLVFQIDVIFQIHQEWFWHCEKPLQAKMTALLLLSSFDRLITLPYYIHDLLGVKVCQNGDHEPPG